MELEWKMKVGIGLMIAGVIFYLLNFVGFLTYPPGPKNGTVWNVGYILFVILFIIGVTSIVVQVRDKRALRIITSELQKYFLTMEFITLHFTDHYQEGVAVQVRDRPGS